MNPILKCSFQIPRLRLQRRGYILSKPYQKVHVFASVYTKTIYPFLWLLRYDHDMFCYEDLETVIDCYTLKRHHFVLEMVKRKDVSDFVWTDDEVQLLLRSSNGAVLRALAFHQCGPGLIPGPGVICGLSLFLVLYFSPRGSSPGTPVFSSPQKPTFPHSNSILEYTDSTGRVLWTP